MILNLAKAAVSVALCPAAAVADVLTLPSSGYDGRRPFARTEELLKNAGKEALAAVTTRQEKSRNV